MALFELLYGWVCYKTKFNLITTWLYLYIFLLGLGIFGAFYHLEIFAEGIMACIAYAFQLFIYGFACKRIYDKVKAFTGKEQELMGNSQQKMQQPMPQQNYPDQGF